MKHRVKKFHLIRNQYLNVFVFILNVMPVLGDVYLHNPRGSNNRLSESSSERDNNNRLFDSQNNNRGGYNVGGLEYYGGSVLQIEWTNQHSCHSSNNNCEIILQYMCNAGLRDGATSETIPIENTRCQKNNCNKDFTYGMNENYDYYQYCRTRQRNKGLFTADQILKGDSAIYTRQNPEGNRSGFECPEERDYYPYWHPSPWKDIAILTNNVDRCNYYRRESENVKPRYWCHLPKEVLSDIYQKKMVIPSTKDECESFSYPPNNPSGISGVWTIKESHNIPPPECRETEYTLDNHLGNTLDGFPPSFQWILPDLDNEKCVLRIRYNISTMDYDGWNPAINSTLNDRRGSDVLESFNTSLKKEERIKRGFILKTNPQVKMFSNVNISLNLQMNTAQYGRVFEDRSHVFAIIKRPEKITQIIYNLNVQGKRGNIVQVYPAVEYDFNPKTLEISVNDYVHIQWTGSNSNPLNYDGEGQPGTDRSNLLPLANPSYNVDSYNTKGHWGCNYPLENNTNNLFLGFSLEELEKLAFVGSKGDTINLNDASPYFNAGLKQITEEGEYHYFCTRNNNFSNRDQKGRIIVTRAKIINAMIGKEGGSVVLGSSSITIQENALENLENFRIEEWKAQDIEHNQRFLSHKDVLKKDLASSIIIIFPERQLTNETIEVRISITTNLREDFTVYRSSVSNFLLWQRIQARVVGDEAVFQIDRGGVYLVRRTTNSSVIIGVVFVLAISVIIAGGLIYYFKKNQSAWKTMLQSVARK